MIRLTFLLTLLRAACVFAVVPTTGPTKVTFDPDGIAVVITARARALSGNTIVRMGGTPVRNGERH